MLMRATVVMLSLVSVVGVANAAESLTLDTKKSKIEFVGAKPDGKHAGGFKEFTAKAMADFEDPTKGSLEIEIATASLWSDAEKLTSHLKNPDFFDVRKHPKINFKSTQIVPGDEAGQVKILGVMKMLDKEVKVEIPATVEVSDGGVKLVSDFKIDRTKWGMDYGKGKINDEVAIKVTFLFTR
ncbi:YceI family protein [Planctomycetaceae bacterium SH139]